MVPTCNVQYCSCLNTRTKQGSQDCFPRRWHRGERLNGVVAGVVASSNIQEKDRKKKGGRAEKDEGDLIRILGGSWQSTPGV